jgi:hypothetical protein
VFGDVVLGGAQASSDQNGAGTMHGLVDGIPDILPVIAHHYSPHYFESCGGQESGHCGGVGVDYLPDKQLVTYVNYRCIHGAKVRKKQKSVRLFLIIKRIFVFLQIHLKRCLT